MNDGIACNPDQDLMQTMDNSVHRQRVQWKPSEELMLKLRIQSNPYFINNLAPLTPSTKPLILKDKKLWQRLADEHNAELTSKGLSCLKPRTSKSIRDKWRYKLSPYVRNTWIESDWAMLEELLPHHFWKSTSGRRKYNHWQHTFNGWVEMEGSAPSIQIMKNVMEKIKKCVKSGSKSFKSLVPSLYEIACYITSTTCTVVSDLNRHPLHAQCIGQSLPCPFPKEPALNLTSRDDTLPEAFAKDEFQQVLALFSGQLPDKKTEKSNEGSRQSYPSDTFVAGFSQETCVEITESLTSGATEGCRVHSCASHLDHVDSQVKAPFLQYSEEVGFDLRSLPSLTSSEIESLGTHLLPS